MVHFLHIFLTNYRVVDIINMVVGLRTGRINIKVRGSKRRSNQTASNDIAIRRTIFLLAGDHGTLKFI
jgi:hypothetical protein